MHGLDLSRTVGDLHCTFPLAFEDSSAQSPAETLTAVAERLTGVPSAGLSFDGLKYLNDDPEVRRSIRDAPAPTLWFNFQGEMPTRSRSGLFSLREAAARRHVGSRGRRAATAALRRMLRRRGTTRIVWDYSPRQLGWSGAEIDEWMARFERELSGMVRSTGATP